MNIPLNIDFLQILLHMLNFVILSGGLTFLLYKPVTAFLENRQNEFAQIAKKNQEEAEENERLRIEYEQKLQQAEHEIAESKKAAEKETAEISAKHIKEIKEKAVAIIAAAEKEAEERKEHILESAQTEIGELVVSATHELLNDTVTPEQVSALYDEFIRLAESTVADERSKNGKE